MARPAGHLPPLLAVLLLLVWLATRCEAFRPAVDAGTGQEVVDAGSPPVPGESAPAPTTSDIERSPDGSAAPSSPGATTELRGGLEGRLVLADDRPVDPFVWTVRLRGPGRSWPMDAVDLGKDGRFRVTGLPPGTYVAVAEQEGLPVALVESLQVEAGATCRDPRLAPWRVEDDCREMRIRVLGSPGLRGDTQVWALRPSGEPLGHARWVDALRILRCPGGTVPPDVAVIAPGFQPQRLPWQDGEVTVDLKPGPTVTLQAVHPVRLADGIRRGWCVLRPEAAIFGVAAAQFDVEFPAAGLAAGEAVTLQVPASGSYELRFAADTQDGPGFLPLYDTVLARGIRVDADEVTQRVVLPDPLRDNR